MIIRKRSGTMQKREQGYKGSCTKPIDQYVTVFVQKRTGKEKRKKKIIMTWVKCKEKTAYIAGTTLTFPAEVLFTLPFNLIPGNTQLNHIYSIPCTAWPLHSDPLTQARDT